MNEIIKKLLETGNKDAFSSPERFAAAAAELGYGKEAIDAALAGLDPSHLDIDALDKVSGGVDLSILGINYSSLNSNPLFDKSGDRP